MITRRTFIRGATAAAVVGRTGVHHAAAEPPPEVARIRLPQQPSLCVAPQFVSEELLKAEGSYALRLHEAGMVKSTPQKIIFQGTDWRFLNELRKELKG